ncbi:type VI secretion system membrane subunit TssM [Pseudomonas sp. v388]|uniref:type VI secretion system membrane subunit TssM n=1 Tax=Pseudomonas sp. v388 TaxID=2479849 RepID=UPI000F766DF5|nr:type VI secretion system membrane subunit TssM [Pseudomonas sp. v388]RRV05330.1 type VI secretion system membrane subunit TssM [Pseudomonas sp. v388]
MKNLFMKLVGLLRQTRTWTLLLVLALNLVIWFAGPWLAVADHKFWESPTARLLSISLLLLLWGLVMAFAGRQGTAAQDPATPAVQEMLQQDALIADERQALRARFSEAERVLAQSTLYASRDGQARRELPWYLLIGPQGSGKTSLLDFSGLDFPLNKVERSLTRDIRGSRGCDWYFSDQAVILDTAGRYFSQVQQRVDGAAWLNLLDLLRTRRRSRPLNGVLVALPVEALLDAQELRVERLAATVRERLQEVHRLLRIDVPVYLVLTRADALPGFDEFFEQLSREEAGQVLGTTFEPGSNGSDGAQLRQAFEALLARLNGQALGRVHQARGIARRGLILDFPHQLGRIGHNLCLLAELAFAGNRYQRASRLRGYYLTRAPHVGVVAGADADHEPARAEAGSRLPVLSTVGARFIHDLLSRVIFPESSLATLDRDVRRRIAWGQRAGFALVIGVLLGCGTLWATGFSANHQRLEQLRNLAGRLLEQRGALNPGDDLLATLPVLNTASQASRVFPDIAQAALHERGGLYQGEPANRIVSAAYDNELQRQLLPRLARQLEAQIRASLTDREQLLPSLRAYLMLNLRERRDRAWLQDRVASDWALRYAGDAQVQTELNSHLDRLLDQPFVHPLDDMLVAQARQVLRGESLAGAVYRILRDQARSSPDYRLAQHLGSQGNLFAGTDYPIPGFYTRQGYQQYFVARGSRAVTEILHDNWVLGDNSGMEPGELRGLLVELEQLYFRDYAQHWSEALGQVSLQPFEGARQGATQMAGLIAASSPLLQLLGQIREHTRFAVPAPVEPAAAQQTPAAGGVAGKAVVAVAGLAQEAAAGVLPDTAKKALQRRFEPLHRLLDDNNGPAADLLSVLEALSDVQLQLASLGRSGQPELVAFDVARARMTGQRDALSELRSRVGQLPQPVAGWFGTLAEDSWAFVLQETYRHLNQRYQDEVYRFYTQALDKRYPFHAHSSSDVALNDFREFFKAQGIAERFFDTYLKAFVSGEPGSYRLRSVDGLSVPMSRAWLDQLANVQAIRKSFFAHSADEPQVQFKLEPYTLDPAVSRAEFRLGDQLSEYRHGPVQSTGFKWPTEVDDGRAALVLEPMAGRAIGIEKNTGPWSLFRLLDLMEIESLEGRDVLVFKAEVGGLRANYLLMSQRSPNPFDASALRRFRLPAQL